MGSRLRQRLVYRTLIRDGLGNMDRRDGKQDWVEGEDEL